MPQSAAAGGWPAAALRFDVTLELSSRARMGGSPRPSRRICIDQSQQSQYDKQAWVPCMKKRRGGDGLTSPQQTSPGGAEYHSPGRKSWVSVRVETRVP